MSESVIELARIEVQAISVKVRPDPQALEKIEELMLQANADGTVQVDAFGTDPQGNVWHVSRALEEQAYENMRQRLLIKEQASLPPFSSFKSGNTLGRVVGEAAPAAVPAAKANPPIEAETEAEGVTGKQVLDGIQVGLDVIGLVPVFGEIADVANAGVSLARGDYVGAGLSLASAIPFVGWFGTVGKVARYGTTVAEGSGKAAKEVTKGTVRKPNDGAKILKRKKLQPGTLEHKMDRWQKYQERGGKKSYKSWSKQYDTNMRNYQYGLAREKVYRDAMGASEGTLKTPLTNRQIDILKAKDVYAGQLKTGRVSLTKENQLAIQKDASLVKDGWAVEHILEKGATKPYLDALEKAGINYKIGPQVPR